MTTTSAPSAAAPTACSMSAAVSTSIRVTTDATSGGSASGEDVTSVTDAPRRAAATAMACPCLPEERFVMKRTGSSGSRVPPALTTTRSPCRSRRVARGRAARGRAPTITPGIGQPAFARVATGQAPALGRDDLDAPPLAGWPGSRAPTRAPTSRCAWPGRRSPAPGSPGAWRRGGRRRARRHSGPGCAPSPARPRTRSACWPSLVWGIGEASSHSERLHRLGGQGRERHRADEPRRLVGQHRRHVHAGVDQLPADLDRLVGGDATADAEDDAGARCGCGQRSRTGPRFRGLQPSALLAAPVRRAPSSQPGRRPRRRAPRSPPRSRLVRLGCRPRRRRAGPPRPRRRWRRPAPPPPRGPAG